MKINKYKTLFKNPNKLRQMKFSDENSYLSIIFIKSSNTSY